MILPELKGAKEVAVLVKCMPNIEQCAELIEQYARTAAAGARLDATIEAYDRVQEQLAKEAAQKGCSICISEGFGGFDEGCDHTKTERSAEGGQ